MHILRTADTVSERTYRAEPFRQLSAGACLASSYDLLPEARVAQHIGLETIGNRLGSGTYG